MKKNVLPYLVLGLFGLFLFSACSGYNEIDAFEYQSIAWASLSAEEQSTIGHDLREAKVKFDDEFKDWSKQDSKPVPAVSVRFITENGSLLGPIVVYISPKTKKVLGFAPRF